MTGGWLRVVVTSRAEEVGAVDDALEKVGLRDIAHDGEEFDAYVVCESERDLVLTRLAFPDGMVDEVAREDLHMGLREAEMADLARRILSEVPAASGEVRLVRHLRIYVRDVPTYRAIRTGIAACVLPGGASILLV